MSERLAILIDALADECTRAGILLPDRVLRRMAMRVFDLENVSRETKELDDVVDVRKMRARGA